MSDSQTTRWWTRKKAADADVKEVLRLQNEALTSLRQSIDLLSASIGWNKQSIDALHDRLRKLEAARAK